MSFIAVLFALLLEQARPLGRGNPVHASLRAWVRWSTRNFDAGKPFHGWLAWGFAVGGPSLAALAIYWLLDAFLGWPVAVLWSVAVLYVTLGFRQFSFHFTQIRDALADGDEDHARELLADWQQIDASELPRSEIVRHVIEYSVLAAHRHVFGVLAWFAVLAVFGFGPAGAVLYRLSEFVVRYWQHKSKTQHQPVSEALQQTAAEAWAVIDWVPARITAISFAVVGSFEEAIDGWRNYEPKSDGDNDGIILAATSGAVNIRLGDAASMAAYPADGPSVIPPVLGEMSGESTPGQMPELAHLAVIVGLVWRTVVMWMVLLALLTLARLLG
ncbi:MAG: CobD/CbiB family protein [Rhodoferax sp.]|uniref:CobD/CbiB family protein n=1 Tax=Rhodoferax sp. TaxID=50421 RepID=UPI001796457F|nr:CobD/CbiB family protein [Rhodoferax sp.]NMM20796.1 CobD/CbiB family protein [Rhodoferax sp.]